MKTVIVTGAAGFLGSTLTRTLLAQGHRVIGLDNLSTGTLDNVEDLIGNELFTWIVADICKEAVRDLELLQGVDEIYHLASPASPKFYQAAPFATIDANTLGTRNMLELAAINRAKLVYTSTSEAYGDPESHPQREDYRGNVNTWGPRACYDESKRLGETLCYEYFMRCGVKVKVVRLFNTYSAGLRNDDGRVISNFITQALTGSDLTVYGDGMQSRSFCYVEDTIRGLMLAMDKDEADGHIINLGNPEEYTVLEVARMVKRLTGSDSRITFHPLPQDDPRQRRPVIDKARALLGWEPAVDLEEGLRRMIRVYRRKLNREAGAK